MYLKAAHDGNTEGWRKIYFQWHTQEDERLEADSHMSNDGKVSKAETFRGDARVGCVPKQSCLTCRAIHPCFRERST